MDLKPRLTAEQQTLFDILEGDKVDEFKALPNFPNIIIPQFHGPHAGKPPYVVTSKESYFSKSHILHRLVEHNSVKCLEAVLTADDLHVDPNQVHDYHKTTAFDRAIFFGYIDCVKVLMKHSDSHGILLGRRPAPNDDTTVEVSPLVSAIIMNQTEIVRFIVDHRPPIDLDEVCINWHRSPAGSKTPLMISIDFNLPEITKMLLDAIDRLDLSIVDENGWTALHHAAKKGAARPARRLLNAGIDKNIKTNDGETAADLVKLLIDEFTVPETGKAKDPKEMLKKKKAAAQKKKGEVKKKSAKKSAK